MSHPPRFRVALTAIFWHAFLAVAIFMEVGLYHKLRPWLLHRDGGFQIVAMLWKSPKPLGRALLWATLITVIVEVYVQLLVKPWLTRWYAPRRSTVPSRDRLAFHLAAGETIRYECPARFISGRRGEPGMLVRSDRALWFAPGSWDADPWVILDVDRFQATSVAVVPRRGTWWSNLPDTLVVTGRGGIEKRLLVLNTATVLGWFVASADPHDGH